MALRDAVSAIGPSLFEVGDPDLLSNINAPEDLRTATAKLDWITRR